ncbi:ABC transporter ATP-binding protein [Nocardioides marmotae]|uniref:ATP-binding cassette domain-containing protein n=1 Tax=Nocardioides marmotae TaxID=2663857 RepID=A0A6I3JEJ8_9ACTN|nr:ABC transporter ATP-binding protein [Nocardioides marmotae]MCR6032892.1 ATP-binding cassette domain-containing protein [Gordonia jinghuaiqii]MBC9733421.1 ABC transporter ATP-binding protein [Nocardioides marmotae]MTB84528.1 ATP-binding cassette domain-containing protein [Nocardioides marmotae]MTB96542.1 ATP-binding cassette domain-containing protein [Nocardioides marmotae]QKE01937.1 ABC transporter ATP-binding protein [Nocardioides marmotae]
MISAHDIAFAYGRRTVLDGVDLDAPHGQVLGLVGPNGSGKTTLLRTLYASLKPRSGAVLIDGDQLGDLPAREVARRVAVVVQETPGDLPLLVSDMVLLGRTPHRSGFGRNGAEDERIAADALAQVGALHLADQPFDGLSGGERQRVLIARALAQESTHLLLDEPTNHLDVRYQHEVLDLARRLAVENHQTVVVILHDLNLAASYCDRVALLHRGRVVAAGTPAHVLTPEHLEPVYEVAVRRLELDDGFQLAFRPLSAHRTPERTTR